MVTISRKSNVCFNRFSHCPCQPLLSLKGKVFSLAETKLEATKIKKKTVTHQFSKISFGNMNIDNQTNAS